MTTRVFIAIAIVLGILAAWLLLADPRPSPATSSLPARQVEPPLREPGQPRTYVVLMRVEGGRFAFDPAGLLVQPGDEVVWVNLGDNHSTTAYHPENGKELRIPEGAESWDSGILGLGDAGLTFTSTYTFRVEGTYDYFCLPHEFLGMVGRIVVGKPDGPVETTPLKGLPEAAQVEMPSTPQVMTGLGVWAAEINRGLWLLLQNDFERAARHANDLLLAYERGQNRPMSLYTVLKDLGQAEAFARLMKAYRDRLQAGVGFRGAELQADELKALLTRAEGVLLR